MLLLTSHLFSLAFQIIDKSFGFDTAVEEAQRAINAAHVEAESGENGVGFVKLMGRQSGILNVIDFISSTFKSLRMNDRSIGIYRNHSREVYPHESYLQFPFRFGKEFSASIPTILLVYVLNLS